jgi:hypothetical protein
MLLCRPRPTFERGPRLSLAVNERQNEIKFELHQGAQTFEAVLTPSNFPSLSASDLSALRFVTRVLRPGQETDRNLLALELTRKRSVRGYVTLGVRGPSSGGISCDYPGCKALYAGDRDDAGASGWKCDGARNTDFCPLHVPAAPKPKPTVAATQPGSTKAPPPEVFQPPKPAPTKEATAPTAPDLVPEDVRKLIVQKRCTREWTRESATMQRLDKCLSCSSADHECLVCDSCRTACHANHKLETRSGVGMGWCACATLVTCQKLSKGPMIVRETSCTLEELHTGCVSQVRRKRTLYDREMHKQQVQDTARLRVEVRHCEDAKE